MDESPAVREEGLPSYRVELEGVGGGTRRATYVRAGSLEEALVRVRRADQWPSGDPDAFRVVEIGEEGGSSEVRHQRNARRRYLDTIVEAGLAALGTTAPERPGVEFSDVVNDFFSRAVVLPGHYAFPAGDAETERLLADDDVAHVLTGLLATHLAHHGLRVAPIPPE